MAETDSGTRYGNVGVLDLRDADADALRAIRGIGNVGLLLFRADTRPLVNALSIGNLGDMVEAPPHCRLEMGSVRLDREALSNRSTPVSMIVMGQVVMAPDVSSDDVEQGIEALISMGSIVCPDNLTGVLRPKLKRVMGTLTCYPAGCELFAVSGSLELDGHALVAMKDHTALLVDGRLVVPVALPGELLERKLSWIKVHGSLLCNEENAPQLRSLMEDQSTRVTVLPEGFRYVNRSLTIDGTFLRFGGASKLYCQGRVVVDAAVTAAELDRHLVAVRSTNRILVPSALRDAFAPKCDLTQDRVVFYDGVLWLEDGDTTLDVYRLTSLDGLATLWVDGELTIDEAVTPEMLVEKLAGVHNYGTILCTPAQRSALHRRMGENKGEMRDRTTANEEDELPRERGIGNVGYLAL